MKKINLLNIPISQINYLSALEKIKMFIDVGKKAYVCVAAVHLLMECQKNQKLLEGVKKADLVTPDGMPLVWLSKYYSNQKNINLKNYKKNVSRVYGPNLTLLLCKLAQKYNYKIFLLGGAKGQSIKLAKKLQKKFVGLKIVGTQDTPIRPIPKEENKHLVNKINHLKPDIVFVGLGCPNQELWMIENRKKISAPILIGVGAAFNFITGKVKQAPIWMQNAGLEWLFRLIQEPKRLWKRYLIYNTLFLIKIAKQIARDFLKGIL